MKRRLLITALAASGLALAGCGTSSSSSSAGAGAAGSTEGSTSTAAKAGALGPAIGAAGSGPVTKTVGPSGEPAVAATSVTVTPAETKALQNGHYTAAMAWHESGTFTSGVTDGANAEFRALGIKVVATSQANFDVATQVNQLQTMEADKPSAVLSLPVAPASESSAYRHLTATGSKLVLLSNAPTGLTYPKGYSGLVTDDLSAMGRQAAELVGTALHGKGNVGFIYYDANYYVTNERDAAFRTWLGRLFPNIHIVAQEAMPDSTKAGPIATAMMESHSDIQAIYVPFSQPPAEDVISALRGLGDSKVKIVTMDLDPSIDANLCSGQYLAGIVADQPYMLGETLAKEAGLAILHKRVPQFAVVPALAVTKSNILSAWKTTLAQSPPANITSACH